MEISPEVLIYIQNVKNFLNSNQNMKDYFIHDGNEEFFFHHLTEISQKNFKTNGNAMLSVEQFELIRKTMILIKIIEKPEENFTSEDNLFMDLKEFGKFCLN